MAEKQRMKKTFTIEYYKPSGKLYTSDKFEYEVEMCEGVPNTIYMYDARFHVGQLASEGKLPGLADGSHWADGFIRINAEDDSGFPVLIIPFWADNERRRRDI